MNDIVEKLRKFAPQMGHYGAHGAGVLMEQAADEIERLREDAECFRFWVREAAAAPWDMARLIANCITEQEYRDAIRPVALMAQKVIAQAKDAEAR